MRSWAALALAGCAPRVLRLENELLHLQARELREQLGECEQQRAPSDLVRQVDALTLRQWLVAAGYQPVEAGPGIWRVEVRGGRSLQIAVQSMPRDSLVYLVTHDYFDLDVAAGPGAVSLVLAQMATLNYQMLVGKLQLNPSSGAVSLSVELSTRDGLSQSSFEAALRGLIAAAESSLPALERAAEGQGL